MGKIRKNKKGFTLVELLLVIAIIGILIGIVYVSLKSAIINSKNKRISSNISQIRKIAQQIYLDSNAGYSGLCSSQTTLNPANIDLYDLQKDIETLGGSIRNCKSNQESYCITVNLIANQGFFCIDDEGRFSKLASGSPDPCQDANSVCP